MVLKALPDPSPPTRPHRFQPYDLNKEHRLTLNISANLLVGFFLELGLALWSSRVGWRGVQSPEFSASNTKRDVDAVDQRSVTPLPPRPGQQVPLAALYQLLQVCGAARGGIMGGSSMGDLAEVTGRSYLQFLFIGGLLRMSMNFVRTIVIMIELQSMVE